MFWLHAGCNGVETADLDIRRWPPHGEHDCTTTPGEMDVLTATCTSTMRDETELTATPKRTSSEETIDSITSTSAQLGRCGDGARCCGDTSVYAGMIHFFPPKRREKRKKEERVGVCFKAPQALLTVLQGYLR